MVEVENPGTKAMEFIEWVRLPRLVAGYNLEHCIVLVPDYRLRYRTRGMNPPMVN